MMASFQYSKVEANMQQVQINLTGEVSDLISQSTDYIVGTLQKNAYVKFIVELVVISILVTYFFLGYLDRVKIRTYKSSSMALMIPVTLISKNPDIIAILWIVFNLMYHSAHYKDHHKIKAVFLCPSIWRSNREPL